MCFKGSLCLELCITITADDNLVILLSIRTLVCEMPLTSTLVAGIAGCPHFVSEHVLLLRGHIHRSVCSASHIRDAILLHQVLGDISLIVGARQRTSLHDANGLVEPGPCRAGSALVLVEALGHVGGLADVVLATCEFENVERVHLERDKIQS